MWDKMAHYLHKIYIGNERRGVCPILDRQLINRHEVVTIPDSSMPSRPRAHSTIASGRRVTLAQIAAEVDLPVMAVSRALNGRPGMVSEARRERILAVAKRLGYRPNLMARAMQTGRSHIIGVAVPPIGDFGSRMVRGIHDVLGASGHLPLLHWRTPEQSADPQRMRSAELAVVNALLDHRVAGVILFPADDWVLDLHFRELHRRGVPLVTVDRQLQQVAADFAGTDDRCGARLAAEHLLALGHRHVAQLAGAVRYGTYADRRNAFEETIRSAGGTCVTLEKPAFNELADTIRQTNRLLDAQPRPSAVFLAHDHLAEGVFATAAARGLQIPRDLSVIGFADLAHAALMHPPLTTVRQDPESIGRRAADLLLRRCLGQETGEPVRVRLVPELIVRASTATLIGK
jgi:LacI family transcriptional regulator